MSEALQKSVESVYEAFRDISRPESIDGCPCCIDEEEINVLLSKPLRELSLDDLSGYIYSALLTVGTVEDFMYLLPRILEILASESYYLPDQEVVARAIHSAGFHTWSDNRKRAVFGFFDRMIGDLLAKEGLAFELESWICALGRLHVDLAPYLKRIAENGRRLIEYYEMNSEALVNSRLSNAFWDETSAEHRQIVDWFQSEEIQNLINKEYGLA